MNFLNWGAHGGEAVRCSALLGGMALACILFFAWWYPLTPRVLSLQCENALLRCRLMLATLRFALVGFLGKCNESRLEVLILLLQIRNALFAFYFACEFRILNFPRCFNVVHNCDVVRDVPPNRWLSRSGWNLSSA